jgi:hypothetical protein
MSGNGECGRRGERNRWDREALRWARAAGRARRASHAGVQGAEPPALLPAGAAAQKRWGRTEPTGEDTGGAARRVGGVGRADRS